MAGVDPGELNSEWKKDRKKLLLCMVIPFIFIAFMWLSLFAENLFNTDFSFLGIYPLEIKGLPGIFLSPFIHSDINHLLGNSLPLFILGTALFYFYTEVAFRVSFWVILLTGLTVWVFGRPSYHIGASGMIYGLASFLFFSGILRMNIQLIGVSLLVVFLYGQIVWGVFPWQKANISWESHMLGFVAGIFLAIYYRKEGPQRPEPFPDDEGENDDDIKENSDDNDNMIN